MVLDGWLVGELVSVERRKKQIKRCMSGGGSRSRRCGSNKDDMLDGLLNETVKLSVGVRSD